MSSLAINEVIEAFEEIYDHPPEYVVRAPGRVNLIGDHTDYNEGFVLPMAIDRSTFIAASLNTNSDVSVAYSAQMKNRSGNRLNTGGEFRIASGFLEKSGDWTDYLKGVAAEFIGHGLRPITLNLFVTTSIPIGCGLSSSAALQVAMAKLLQEVQPGVVQDKEVAELCQIAEHQFTGTPVGIMDQFCIVHSREDHLLFLDCRSLIPSFVKLNRTDVTIVVLDGNVPRQLRQGAYAERREQCRLAGQRLGVKSLRDAEITLLDQYKDILDTTQFKRVRHVISENQRTLDMVRAIKNEDWSFAGKLMYQSHYSMREDFENSVQHVDELVQVAKRIGVEGGIYGARMTGGGFGGCVVCLIKKTALNECLNRLEANYEKTSGLALNAYPCSAAGGANVANLSNFV